MPTKEKQPATLDQLLFRKILIEQQAVWKLERLGVKRSFFTRDVQRAWDFVETFRKNNSGEIPSDEVLCFELEWDDTPLEEFPVTVPYLAQQIRRRVVEGRLVTAIDTVQKELQRGQDYIFDAQHKLIEAADDLRGLGADGLTATNMFELYPEVLLDYDQYKEGDIGIPTPWNTITENVLGYQLGQIVFFCARPSTGKTWALLDNCLHLHSMGNRVLLITPELTEAETAERCLCMQTKTSYERFTKGELDHWSEGRMRDAVDELRDLKNFWVADSTMRIEKNEAEALLSQYDPDVVAIDSVYCFGDGRNRNERISNVVPWLIEVARQHGRLRLVLATTQMNRNASTAETTTIDNIYGSDAVGQDAHLIYGLFQSEEMYRDKTMGVTQIKVRRGKRHDPFYCNWDLDAMDFSEITKTGYERDEDDDDDDEYAF